MRVKLITGNIVKKILGTGADMERVWKLCADSGLSELEVRAAVSTLDFIVASAVKYCVSGVALTEEIAQLGLPLENAQALTRAVDSEFLNLRKKLEKDFLRTSECKLDNYIVEWDTSTKRSWARLEFGLQNVVMNQDELCLLIGELERAKSIMDKLA